MQESPFPLLGLFGFSTATHRSAACVDFEERDTLDGGGGGDLPAPEKEDRGTADCALFERFGDSLPRLSKHRAELVMDLQLQAQSRVAAL